MELLAGEDSVGPGVRSTHVTLASAGHSSVLSEASRMGATAQWTKEGCYVMYCLVLGKSSVRYLFETHSSMWQSAKCLCLHFTDEERWHSEKLRGVGSFAS